MRPILQAVRGGLIRSIESRSLLAALLLLNLAFALPAGWVITSSLHESVKTSRASENLRRGFDMGWYGEYRASASEMEQTFKPDVLVGVSAFLENMEAWASGGLWRGFSGLVVDGILFALVWTFLLGGLLDRFVHGKESCTISGFFQSCGRFAGRFYRLAALSGVLYFAVYKLFGWAYTTVDRMTRDIPSERVLLFLSLAVVAATVVLLNIIQICFAYAKIATVREARTSMLGAALRGIGFVLSHPVSTLGLALGLGLISLGLLVAYSLVAPGTGGSGWAAVVLAILLGQIYLGVKMFMRLWLLGGEVSLFTSMTSGPGASGSPELGAGPAAGEVLPSG